MDHPPTRHTPQSTMHHQSLSSAPPCTCPRPSTPPRRPRHHLDLVAALAAATLALLLIFLPPTALAAPAASASKDKNRLTSCGSAYALWNRDIPAEFDLGFLSVKSGFECAGHVIGGAYARVAVYKKGEGRCYMKGVPQTSAGTLHGQRGEILGSHRIPGHRVTSATYVNKNTSPNRLNQQSGIASDDPPYNWSHIFAAPGSSPAACDLVFRQGDEYECQRFKECADCVMYVGWNCAADEEEEEEEEEEEGGQADGSGKEK